MPSTYAHHRFGDKCTAALPPEGRQAVQQHRSLYDIGVHGPDLFFYYHPLKSNPISAYGSQLHRQPARVFFERAKPVRERCGDKDEMLAYLLGFLSHFVLDSACHGYVEQARKELGITHNRLESLFEAYLMRADGLTPSRVRRGTALHPSPERAAVIARFFDQTPQTVLAAGRGQVRVMGLLYSPRGIKKRVFRALLRALGIGSSFDDLFIDDDIPAECQEALAELDRLYAQALAEYGPLAEALLRYLNGGGPLPARFDRNFD